MCVLGLKGKKPTTSLILIYFDSSTCGSPWILQALTLLRKLEGGMR
uniref:Uncharacterized protein n=1 Tax=Utricularia reniformis TaxID=192314 RepID=A0A1Y0B3J8_9LAMI|nr:hypothetical protein AEK19_MT1731 [Utricularia reniformis]ART31909.1 hypothetical protein AEK19_MT1731 [Utricularia reniformis]